MVEYAYSLDAVFGSLSDPTRRDILARLTHEPLSIGDIAKPYDLTFAAVSKHLKVLEKARLVFKRRQGKEQIVHIMPDALANIDEYLEQYRQLWDKRLDSLDNYLKSTNKEG